MIIAEQTFLRYLFIESFYCENVRICRKQYYCDTHIPTPEIQEFLSSLSHLFHLGNTLQVNCSHGDIGPIQDFLYLQKIGHLF